MPTSAVTSSTRPGWLGLVLALLAATAHGQTAPRLPSPMVQAADQLMDFGQAQFPALFPAGAATQALSPFRFRYYPSGGVYLGVVVEAGQGYPLDGVYVLGGSFGAAPVPVGRITDFILPVQANRIACSSLGQFTLARADDGTVWAWGDNTYGQLGDGTLTDRHSPVQVPGIADARMVATSRSHAVVLSRTGQARAMGNNKSGQLGTGSASPAWSATPVAVSAPGAWSAVAASDGGAAADTQGVSLGRGADGSAWYWGYNAGRTGTQPLSSTAPQRIDGWPALVSLASGNDIAALTANGELWAWGVSLDVWGVGGASADTPSRLGSVPALAEVAVGTNHVVALAQDGRVYTWGANSHGELGYATPNGGANAAPTVVHGLADIVAVAAGQYYSLALGADGRVRAWGYNYKGRLGLGSPADQIVATPTAIPTLTGVNAMCAGWMHAAFVRDDGTVWAVGDNSRGQLGAPAAGNGSGVPVQVPGLKLQ